ncbi:serine/threonine-protein kinase [Salinibacterium hongtaonis]|uniref:serine/threonine-protein kinase n=1 Tax=Homoserinimonas hongtaonis TaxID=2079791 RepID=UPI000D3A2CC0|nr:serine/threonine-protein kinase [Salinibacterium hongtaonis]AWB88845.1 serine/threonine protein kinase [Salinibacterium hongtaonis]
MARRLPSQPPVLPGFNHLHVLGSGGFADVFLYEQNMPRRQVAVKVLLSEVVNDHVRQMFQAEANLMAQLSSHPSILTVYQASVSADGRPYLVMEMCSSALSERYRREAIPVGEVLRIAVRIGSAIETAHRAGVLHRDIKPSNILLTAYGHPVLSDFGIAATVAGGDADEAVGMSIPWSAPEILLGENSGSVAAEVWSFAATVYSLLAGRSPFEVQGKPNKSADLIGRISKARPQPIARPDVSAGLENVLAKAMSRNPAERPASVLELVNQLQSIESELGLPQTPIEVAMDDWALGSVSDLEDRTQVRAIAAADSSPRPKRRRRRPVGGITGESVAEHALQVGSVSSATGRPSGPTKTIAWILVVVAGLVIALAGTAVYVLIRSNSSIPTVSNIQAAQTPGGIEFTWSDPGLLDGDSYQIETSDGERSVQLAPTFTVSGESGEDACITVKVNRSGVVGPASNEKCAAIRP